MRRRVNIFKFEKTTKGTRKMTCRYHIDTKSSCRLHRSRHYHSMHCMVTIHLPQSRSLPRRGRRKIYLANHIEAPRILIKIFTKNTGKCSVALFRRMKNFLGCQRSRIQPPCADEQVGATWHRPASCGVYRRNQEDTWLRMLQ